MNGRFQLHHWISALSLDAPAVALAWQWLFADTFSARLQWTHRVVLAGVIWIAYTGDRVLDARESPASARHWFARRHRRTLAWFGTALGGGLLVLSFVAFGADVVKDGLCMVALVGVYLVCVHGVGNRRELPGAKEWLVGILFSCGVALFVYQASDGHRPALFVAVLTFACLCFANCRLISKWENEFSSARGSAEGAGSTGDLSDGFKVALACGIGVAWYGTSAAIGIGSASRFYAAVLASFVCLEMLDRRAGGVELELRRVLADAALMSPLIAGLLS